MRLAAIAFIIAASAIPATSLAIEGWGIKEQAAPETPNQSKEPQEPESSEPDASVAPDETPANQNPDEPLPPGEQPAPAPDTQAAAPTIINQDGQEGEVEKQPEEEKWHDAISAKLQGLNKVTARTSEITVKVGESTKFGNLELKIEKCLRGPEDEKIENTVLMTIWDEIPGQQRKEVFRGWMFSSSPAISALEHPIYDVILLSCNMQEKPAAAPAKAEEPAKTPEVKKTEKKK